MAEIVDSIAENRDKTAESLSRDEEVLGAERRKSSKGREKNGRYCVHMVFKNLIVEFHWFGCCDVYSSSG